MLDAASSLSIEALLRRNGPMHSSRLLELLRESGVSPDAARKRLERARFPVSRLPDLRLPDGGKFWYLPDQVDTDTYWQKLVAALEETHSVYGVTLNSLDAHGGLVPERQFLSISGSPSIKRGHLSASAVRVTLETLRLLEPFEDPVLGQCLRLTPHAPFTIDSIIRRRATLVAEQALLQAFNSWARKLGLVSFNKTRLRDDEDAPEFGRYTWDFSAPSYIHPLRTGGSEASPGFVVADAILIDGLRKKQAQYFFRKVASLRATPGIRPFLAVLIASRFEPEALKEGRETGILMATPGNLFGESIERALREIVQVLSNPAAAAVQYSEQIGSILEKMKLFEGAMQQLRGPLFELIVGHCVQRSEEGSVDVDRDVTAPSTGQRVNIDVLHFKGTRAVTAYECKGRLSDAMVSKPEVEDWLTRQVPRILDYIRSREDLNGRDITVAFWTTGGFTPEVISYLEERKRATRRYSIDWKDGQAVRSYAKDNHLSGIVGMLDNYYHSPET